ncbi:hypothetical protein DL93DRAFT_1692801 [Clavulina sp. PMI_390]|nr:hypothetical protein DL93DRAFT_1692801 [Clavulina sp. PMI_390]
MPDVYPPDTRIWIPNNDLGWIGGKVMTSTGEVKEGGTYQLKIVDDQGKESVVQSNAQSRQGSTPPPPLRNPPEYESSDDLANLHYLNEPSVLYAIQQRYAQRLLYTYSGLALIAVNSFQRVPIYGPDYVQKYSDRTRVPSAPPPPPSSLSTLATSATSDSSATISSTSTLPPHIFAIAEDARLHMRANGIGQTIIVSGDSGAGKTESAKLIMRFLASRTSVSLKRSTAADELVDDAGEIERRMLATNPILEAFGNAKTVHNDNSSRFGKYLQILFDKDSHIVGAQIRTYLLERSRLVFQSGVERNFHIFYQLFAGLPSADREELQLNDPTAFSYLRPNEGVKEVVQAEMSDDQLFEATVKALSTVRVDTTTQHAIFRLLAAILHLGNIRVAEKRGSAEVDATDPALLLSSSLLGIAPDDLRKWMIKKQISARSERIIMSLNAAQGASVRDGIAKYIYARLFEWLIAIVNESLAGEDGLGPLMADSFIGILDIYGFEYYTESAGNKNGKSTGLVNSFEQFCINYANERLQHEFNSHVFRFEQDEYVREGIKWSFIDFPDNQPCIDAIEGRLGIISLLDEESKLASGSDTSFLRKVVAQLATPAHKNVIKPSRFGGSGFIIAHYAANVTYESQGFIEKNRDTLPEEHLEMLDTTSNDLLRQILNITINLASPRPPSRPFSPARSESDFGGSPTTQGFDRDNSRSMGVQSALNASSRPTTPSGHSANENATRVSSDINHLPSTALSTRKQTLGALFKLSLASLMDTIAMTNPHYVRCIKPNRAKKAWEFDSKHVLSQLRACGILETVRISCSGYPSRWTYQEFASRYYMIMPSEIWTPWPPPKELCSLIIKAHISDPAKYQLGLTKIFFRAGTLSAMDAARSAKIEWVLALVRRHMVRYRAVQWFKNAKAAILRIQRWWRRQLAWKAIMKLQGEAAMLAKQQALAKKRAQAAPPPSANGRSGAAEGSPNGKTTRPRPPRAKPPPLGKVGSKHYHPRTSSTLKDTLEEHFLVWPSDSFPDLIGSTMGPRQAIDVPRDSITIQTKPWPTSNGTYTAKFRGIWNLRAMALKQLKSDLEPEDIVARFHKEIQAWSRLKHSNISPFIGVFVDAQRSIFLVEPWSLNGDVIQYLRAIRPSADRVALLSQIARGLAYLHEEQISLSTI